MAVDFAPVRCAIGASRALRKSIAWHQYDTSLPIMAQRAASSERSHPGSHLEPHLVTTENYGLAGMVFEGCLLLLVFGLTYTLSQTKGMWLAKRVHGLRLGPILTVSSAKSHIACRKLDIGSQEMRTLGPVP